MKYLIIAFLSAAIALINALRISSPAGGESLIIGSSYRVTWSDHKSLDELYVYLVDLNESPPFYLLLKKRDSNEEVSHADIVIPKNILPGTYQLQITGRNPYNVHDTSSKIKLSYRSSGPTECLDYLADDGSSELGPTPDESPAPESELKPESGPTSETELDECPEECTECDDECNECDGEPVCDDDENDLEHDENDHEHDENDHEHDENDHEHEHQHEDDECEEDDGTNAGNTGSGTKDNISSKTSDSGSDKKTGDSGSDKKAALPSVGSMNIVTGFWLIIMIAISSILFL